MACACAGDEPPGSESSAATEEPAQAGATEGLGGQAVDQALAQAKSRQRWPLVEGQGTDAQRLAMLVHAAPPKAGEAEPSRAGPGQAKPKREETGDEDDPDLRSLAAASVEAGSQGLPGEPICLAPAPAVPPWVFDLSLPSFAAGCNAVHLPCPPGHPHAARPSAAARACPVPLEGLSSRPRRAHPACLASPAPPVSQPSHPQVLRTGWKRKTLEAILHEAAAEP